LKFRLLPLLICKNQQDAAPGEDDILSPDRYIDMQANIINRDAIRFWEKIGWSYREEIGVVSKEIRF